MKLLRLFELPSFINHRLKFPVLVGCQTLVTIASDIETASKDLLKFQRYSMIHLDLFQQS